MHEEEIIKQLKAENERLKRENEYLKEQIAKLEARLAKYENAHTPPSLRRGRKRKKGYDEGVNGKLGQRWQDSPPLDGAISSPKTQALYSPASLVIWDKKLP